MGYCNVGEVAVYGFYNLVVVISQLLKLVIKVVQTGDELHLRRVAFDNNKLLGEEPFDDKSAAVVLQSGFGEHPSEANIFLCRQLEIVPMDAGIGGCRPSGSLFSGCHSVW